MKIAIFTETYLPDINGVVTHIKMLKEGLESLGHEVLIVTADAKSRKHYTKEQVLHCPAVSAKRLYNYGLSSPLSLKRLQLLKKYNPDIIHIHQEFGIGLSGAVIAKILHKPLVYTLHTMYDDYIYYVAPKPMVPLVRNMSHYYFKLLADNATALTGPSKKVEEYFKELGVHKPVNVIPNPVELDIFEPSNIEPEKKHAFRAKYEVDDACFLACFCGRLGKEKSVDVLLGFWAQTVKAEDKLRLLIIGDGPSKRELEEQAQALGIADTVIFTGKVPHEELPPYYASCDVYITASLSDTNSISMLEAMATGLPVLHIYDELNRGQVVDGVNGFIYRNAEELRACIDRLRAMPPEEREALSHSVRNSVSESGAQNLANYLVDIYSNVFVKKK